MAFVPREQAQKVYQLAMATDILTQTASVEIAKPEVSEVTAIALGMACHISRQLQVLLEATTGVTPTRGAVEITVVEPGEVN